MITVCLNIVLTGLLCGRLLQVSKHVSSSLGEESAKVYTSAAAILVESSALYTISGIMYLVPYALGVPLADLFGQLWTKMSVSYLQVSSKYILIHINVSFSKVISPLLIILRVVRGRAWTADITVTSKTPLAFATHSVGVGSTTLADCHSQIGLDRLKSSISAT